MKLPIEIFPNPLITSTVEIRFVSKIELSQMFSHVYETFVKELPRFEQVSIPKDIKLSTPQFSHSAEYNLRNDDYKLSFGNNVLSFENVGEYKLWENYFPFIASCITKFFNLGFIEKIERIGVRYASVLNNTTDINSILNFEPDLKIEGYKQKFENYKSFLNINDVTLFLQIYRNAKAVQREKTISGVYIDIDAFYIKELAFEPILNTKIFEVIQLLHKEEKVLFFSLLKPEYLSSLQPHY